MIRNIGWVPFHANQIKSNAKMSINSGYWIDLHQYNEKIQKNVSPMITYHNKEKITENNNNIMKMWIKSKLFLRICCALWITWMIILWYRCDSCSAIKRNNNNKYLVKPKQNDLRVSDIFNLLLFSQRRGKSIRLVTKKACAFFYCLIVFREWLASANIQYMIIFK